MADKVNSAGQGGESSGILSAQRDRAAEIEKLVTNIGKTNIASRNAEQREVKSTELCSLWSQFDANHGVLVRELPEDHPYLLGRLYESTRKCVSLGAEKLETWKSLADDPKDGTIHQAIGTPSPPVESDATSDTTTHPEQKPVLPQHVPSVSVAPVPVGTSPADPPAKQEQATASTLPGASDVAFLPSSSFAGFYGPAHPFAMYAGHAPMSTVLGTAHLTGPATVLANGQPTMATGQNVTQHGPIPAISSQGTPSHWPPAYPTQSMGYPGAPWPHAPQTFFNAQMPKLAPITVPVFNGDWKQWTTFIGLFESLIDGNPTLPPVQKLQYLLNYLQGSAKEAIAHINLCHDNYQVAMSILRRRFDNPRKICNDYVESILDLPPMEHRNAAGIMNVLTLLTMAKHGLKRYGYDFQSSAPVIVTCILRKLDAESRQKFEESLADSRKVPTIDQLTDFLEQRHQVLLSGPRERHQAQPSKKKSFMTVSNSKQSPQSAPVSTCNMCNAAGHRVHQCDKFLALAVHQRSQQVKNKKLCVNCFGSHQQKCPSKYSCRVCKERHHTLLHPDTAETKQSLSYVAKDGRQVLLATALIRVRNVFGQYETLRALVDPGSQDSFITSDAAQQLGLPKTSARISVSGLGQVGAGKVSGQVTLVFKAHHPQQTQFDTTAFVLSRLTGKLPEQPLTEADLPRLPGNITLADPVYHEPGKIDILLGAGIYAEIVKDGTRKYNNNKLLLQNTALGWIMAGRLPSADLSFHSRSFISISELNEKMNRFWEIDETAPQPDAGRQLDADYQRTVTRDSDGRYTVSLPRKSDVYGELGASRNMAVARLINQEKTFLKNPSLAEEYNKFLREYEELGHMSKVDPFSGPEGGVYYLPHHAVIKESSTTTKVRVVFNASAKTHTGLSLNSLLDPGHKLQQDLHHIILRWRKHRFVFTADIEKMFRQINVHKADRDLQRIVWRPSPAEQIQEYQLNTVTYGTASATYLAVRTLLQLAQDEGHHFPLGNEVLRRDFYMDDLISGADTISEALQIRQQVSDLLSRGGFSIRKWTSNSREIINEIPAELHETGEWLLNPEATIKTLGVVWSPQRDEFRIRFDKDDFNHSKLTKRALLSNIATIFDPLGFLAPISFRCKTWMQQLWTEKTDWDEAVSADVKDKWDDLMLELPLISEMTVPRWIHHSANNSFQLHGFCDASEKGYAAVIYSRIVDGEGRVHITLLTAKTKVAPLKNKLTLPRMELAGAQLLANLVHDVVKYMEIPTAERHYWCDSQIALAWIAKPPTTWATYVANRVAAIQEVSSPAQWHYVNTKDNPADVASRGCSPAALRRHALWWQGPQWLATSPESWTTTDIMSECNTELEKRPQISQSYTAAHHDPSALLNRFSSFSMLVRVVAWIQRFKRHASGGTRITGNLNTAELEGARNNVLKQLQAQVFSEEINALQKKLPIPRQSRLASLAPYLDDNGLLRVGGRLRHSQQSYNAIHPILLPRRHPTTKAIIIEMHSRTLHGGAQLTLTLIRRNYWISDGRATVQAVIRSCVRCRRFAASPAPQQMGDLPASRVTAAPAFTRTGVDYCGPFLYRCSQGRGIKTTKGYVAVFVCFTTKAIHLELVSDLTTEAFLAAFKRFVARRGLPSEVSSDNGTNFQGAARDMKRQMQIVLKEANAAASAQLANDGVTWRFIPPYSPHIGGLWEAGVKAVKKHMKRVLDDTKLTFEEFTTVLCQIEACVNSRPLFAVTNGPSDFTALTPGHFLIMRPLLARPEPEVLESNPVNRWRLLTKIHQDFWTRWSTEYLAQLQQRYKWKQAQRNPVIGELVLMKDKVLPPAKWALGRIEQLHPGDDGKTRLVTIRTRGTQVKQTLTNTSPLMVPTDMDDRDPPQDPQPTTQSSLAITHTPSRPAFSTKLISFLICLLAVSTTATKIIATQPGLYVERIGHCQLKRGTLRLQTQISFAEMAADERHVTELGKNLSAIYNQWNQRHYGGAAEAQQFAQMFQHFERKRLHITERISELQTARQRQKRGIFGKLMTAVFGVNDEVYAELDHMQKGQQINNQNILRVSTMLERTHQDLLQHRKKLDETLRHSTELIKSLSLESYRHTLMHHLAAAYTNAMGYLDEAYKKYDVLEKAILGRSSIMELMPLQQVNRAIRNATARLPYGYYVRTIPDLYVETNITTEHLTISGFFPIASSQLFDLINVTPIPAPRNNTFVIPNLSARTVALNYNDQLHFELNEDQLAACQRTAENMYLCDTPVLATMNFETCSILTEIYNRTGSLPCDSTALAINGVLWQKLMRPNTWLFTTNASTLIAVICKSEREDMHIQGSGIIKLEPGCMIKTAAHTIHSLFYLDLKVMDTFIHESILPADSPISRRLELKDPPPFADPMALLSDVRRACRGVAA